MYFHCRQNLRPRQKTQLAKTIAFCSDPIADGSFIVSAFPDIPTGRKCSECRRFVCAIAVKVHKKSLLQRLVNLLPKLKLKKN
jgi:hypothetical protein